MLDKKIIKILVVEDEVYWFDLLRGAVEKRGLPFHLRWAQDGGQAVEVFRQGGSFDGVLMNIAMPMMDSITAAGVLRRLGVEIPIIAWTASAEVDHGEACREAGMVDYIEKNDLTLVEDLIEALHGCGVWW